MGFRTNAFATVWSVEPGKSPNATKVRISTSRKNKQTEEWEQDFSGFVNFVGDAGRAAAKLKEKDRIKILGCDVTSRYDADAKREYVYYTVFEFEKANGNGQTAGKRPAAKPAVDDGEIDDAEFDDNCPF